MNVIKVIYNYCDVGGKCMLMVDGLYFYCDDNSQYPESRTKDVNRAHMFRSQKNAMEMTT